MAVHSTLTKTVGQAWLDHMRAAAAKAAKAAKDDGDGNGDCGEYGCFDLLGLLEPHKRFQNS
ncbi:hypothetical protein ACI3PL_25890, partial [Lacticaseibacillus paracasei]